MEKGKPINARVPVLGFVAPSGTGKTTLLRQVLKLLIARGLRVGVVKQAREDFDLDQPGKDSYRLRKAGVDRLLLTSSRKSALILEHTENSEPKLQALLELFDQTSLDLILVEGFSEAPFPKLVLQRQGSESARFLKDPFVVALATDRLAEMDANIPILDINDPLAVAECVVNRMLC